MPERIGVAIFLKKGRTHDIVIFIMYPGANLFIFFG
jgi:hypothetical protein